jgi:hypothetical protein
LQRFAERKLVEMVDENSVCEVAMAAETCSSEELLEGCVAFVKGHLAQIVESQNVFDFSESFVDRLSDSLMIPPGPPDLADTPAAAEDRLIAAPFWSGAVPKPFLPVPKQASAKKSRRRKPKRSNATEQHTTTEAEFTPAEPVTTQSPQRLAGGWAQSPPASGPTSLRNIIEQEEQSQKRDWAHRAKVGSAVRSETAPAPKRGPEAKPKQPKKSAPQQSVAATPPSDSTLRQAGKPWERVALPVVQSVSPEASSLRDIQRHEEHLVRKQRETARKSRGKTLADIQEDELALKQLRDMFGDDVEVPLEQAQLFLASALGWS